MIEQNIGSGQVIFRSIHHPFAFAGSGKRFDSVKSWNLKQVDDRFVASVVWQRFAPSNCLVHEYGYRNSSRRNQNSRNRDIYCGFYAISVDRIREVRPAEGVVKLDVEHKIELGEFAHVNLYIYLNVTLDEGEIEAAKTYAIDRLWRLMNGPERVNLDVSQNHTPHPSRLLTSLSPYFDLRSDSLRIIDWIYFRAAVLHYRARDIEAGVTSMASAMAGLPG